MCSSNLRVKRPIFILFYLAHSLALLSLTEQILGLGEWSYLTRFTPLFILPLLAFNSFYSEKRSYLAAGYLLLTPLFYFTTLLPIAHLFLASITFISLLNLLKHPSRSFLAISTATALTLIGVFCDYGRDDFLVLFGDAPLRFQYWHLIGIVGSGYLLSRNPKLGSSLTLFSVVVFWTLHFIAPHMISGEGINSVTMLLLLYAIPGAWSDRYVAFGMLAGGGIFGAVLAVAPLNSKCGDPPPFPEVSQLLVEYLLLAEDPRFPIHTGVDLHRLRMAVNEALSNGKEGRGGSTITMQLAKVCYLYPEKTLLRKLKQIVTAWRLERRYSKRELLSLYLSSVPFGNGVIGINRASEIYFKKPPSMLTPEEDLALVLTIYAPGNYNPAISMNSEVNIRKSILKGRIYLYDKVLGQTVRILAFD